MLFNASPRIDLTKDSSIEQISKLQKYKKDQSANSFYKEFIDEDSFKTIALQEIRLWLRELNSNSNNISVLDGGEIGIDEHVSAGTQNNYAAEVKPSKNQIMADSSIEEQSELGFLDCVVYITNISMELKILFDEYGALVTNFQTRAEEFIQKFTFNNKQKNVAASLVLCKSFAKDATEWSNQIDSLNNSFESKWNNICSYIKIVPKNMISQDDKIITKSSLVTLRNQFSNMMCQTHELLVEIDKIPNIQREFNLAMKTFKSTFIKFDKFLGEAIINCEEMENLFI